MSESIAELNDLGSVAIDVENGVAPEVGSQTMLMSELTGYLGELGLGEEHLAKVISLMQATGGEGIPTELRGGTSANAQPAADAIS